MLKVDIQNSVAQVVLDRPDVHNAFNEELIARLDVTFSEIGTRTDVRAADRPEKAFPDSGR